ncbi:hypothetical protein HZU77_013665 [Neisseriaceae bacterium TC5R-5]|nr:hypothetical protein [Neisseriaceae bacterium TC5R-5]
MMFKENIIDAIFQIKTVLTKSQCFIPLCVSGQQPPAKSASGKYIIRISQLGDNSLINFDTNNFILTVTNDNSSSESLKQNRLNDAELLAKPPVAAKRFADSTVEQMAELILEWAEK